jgi:hypothetical protein
MPLAARTSCTEASLGNGVRLKPIGFARETVHGLLGRFEDDRAVAVHPVAQIEERTNFIQRFTHRLGAEQDPDGARIVLLGKFEFQARHPAPGEKK